MLVTLNVKNFAIIDNIQVDFENGFTVLTGETGAGKSLIIDAISLLFGERASSDLIRYGEQKAIIEGVFSNYDSTIKSLLEDIGIEYNDNDFLLIKREIYLNVKSLCKINNQTVSLNQLKLISSYIGDIHSQLDTFGLINPKNYLSFLKDSFIDEELMKYSNLLKNYNSLVLKAKKLEDEINENNLKKDYLEYQFNELEKANLNLEEENNLNNELKILSNSEKVKTLIYILKQTYTEKNLLDSIYESISILSKLSDYNKSFEDMKKIVEDAYYSLESISTDKLLNDNNYDFNEQRFNEINERLTLYSDLKRKYKKNINELIEYKNNIKNTLYSIENYDSTKAELEFEIKKIYDDLLSSATIISDRRKENANKLINDIKNHLDDLQLNNVKFEIQFKENVGFTKDGIDEIDFMISFNKGEPLKPLSKVASGGELSRFMLALKTVLGDQLPMQIKIFDEIDSGVSGSIAYSIGKKLLTISKKSQVLCITHLPQVASVADNHFKIEKTTTNNKTYTLIKKLNYNERINEIANLLSNGNITENSLRYAEELLKNK